MEEDINKDRGDKHHINKQSNSADLRQLVQQWQQIFYGKKYYHTGTKPSFYGKNYQGLQRRVSSI